MASRSQHRLAPRWPTCYGGNCRLRHWSRGLAIRSSPALGRSGKTTVLYQTAKRLVEEEGLDPLKVVFLSLEEAAFVGTRLDQILDMLVPITQVTPEAPAVLLLDEIWRIRRLGQDAENLLRRSCEISVPDSRVIQFRHPVEQRENRKRRRTLEASPPDGMHVSRSVGHIWGVSPFASAREKGTRACGES